MKNKNGMMMLLEF